jgi:hypothetical protein
VGILCLLFIYFAIAILCTVVLFGPTEASYDLLGVGLYKVIYDDANLQKKAIANDNRNKCGVYEWTNKINGARYVGSSVSLTRRLNNYFSAKVLASKRRVSLIHNALLKYGHSNFSLKIIEYCDPSVLLARETHFIGLLKPRYNILQIAGSAWGCKRSEITKAKIRA